MLGYLTVASYSSFWKLDPLLSLSTRLFYKKL